MNGETFSAIVALAGAVIGAGAILVAQAMGARRDAKAERMSRRREQLIDVQKAAVEFHEAVQMARHVADHAADDHEKGAASAKMWATRRALTLIGPDSFDAVTRTLSDHVERLIWDDHEGWATEHSRDEMLAFDEVVRSYIRREQIELGIAPSG